MGHCGRWNSQCAMPAVLLVVRDALIILIFFTDSFAGMRDILMERGLWPAGGLHGKCKRATDHQDDGSCCAGKSIKPFLLDVPG
jgi:hypothetical protein